MDHHPHSGSDGGSDGSSEGGAQDAHRSDEAWSSSRDGRIGSPRPHSAWSARWASWSRWSRTPGAGMFLLGAALAFGVIAASGEVSGAVRSMRQANVIRVKGVGMAPVTADQAWWTGTVTARAGSLPEAFQKLDASTLALRGFVLGEGITSSDIEVDSVRTSIENRRDAEGNLTNEIEVYTLRRSVTIWSKDVRRVERIAMRSTDLIREGHEVGSALPRYLVSTIESLKLQLIEQGTANARERAQLLVDGSGGRLGRLISASQGAFDIVCAGSAEYDGMGSYDTSCINKEARVVVTLEYAVE
ncbi:MAG: SIMPL domain-containing protein [Planctomycetes bacterium]|nr:SIMPL domain-containing protein [Planctomycetota bacterium]